MIYQVINHKLEVIAQREAAHVEEVLDALYPDTPIVYLGEYEVKVLTSPPVIITHGEGADYLTTQDFD